MMEVKFRKNRRKSEIIYIYSVGYTILHKVKCQKTIDLGSKSRCFIIIC